MSTNSIDIKDRIFLVTGGTSGVGKATALGLAHLGAKLVILSRSAERGQAAVNYLAEATGNQQAEYLVGDLSLQSSIRQAGEEFKRRFDHLHVLANLAGGFYFEKQLTTEGIERTFASNYLGHFLLTHLLVDMLKESGPARVLNVVGNPRFFQNPQIDFADLQKIKRFSPMHALGNAMFARIYSTFELARRLEGTGVTAVAFHPGAVKSNLAANAPTGLKVLGKLVNLLCKDTCEIGVYLATAKEIEKVSGVFYNNDKLIANLNPKYEPEIGKQLWRLSEQLTGISTG